MSSSHLEKSLFTALWLFIIAQSCIVGHVYYRITMSEVHNEMNPYIFGRAYKDITPLHSHVRNISKIEAGDLDGARASLENGPTGFQFRVRLMIDFFKRTDHVGLDRRSCALARKTRDYYQHKPFSNMEMILLWRRYREHAESYPRIFAYLEDARTLADLADASALVDLVQEDADILAILADLRKDFVRLEEEDARILVDLEELARHCVHMPVRNDSDEE